MAWFNLCARMCMRLLSVFRIQLNKIVVFLMFIRAANLLVIHEINNPVGIKNERSTGAMTFYVLFIDKMKI
jgi:hypothetical protein